MVSGFDGILGAAVLARFVIQLDYSTPSVVLEPSRLFAEGLPEDMAGISGRITGESIELTAVSPGSPAWEAGLREGDVLLSIDGIETGTDLVLVDSLSEGPAGAARTVRAVRDGSEFEARVVLRPLL
jgi:predicted metalloprotease with PDZ domain